MFLMGDQCRRRSNMWRWADYKRTWSLGWNGTKALRPRSDRKCFNHPQLDSVILGIHRYKERTLNMEKQIAQRWSSKLYWHQHTHSDYVRLCSAMLNSLYFYSFAFLCFCIEGQGCASRYMGIYEWAPYRTIAASPQGDMFLIMY